MNAGRLKPLLGLPQTVVEIPIFLPRLPKALDGGGDPAGIAASGLLRELGHPLAAHTDPYPTDDAGIRVPRPARRLAAAPRRRPGVDANGSADEVRRWLWLHRVRMVDLDAVGFGYAFQAGAAGRTLCGITDRTVWGLAGTAAGLTVLTHQTYALNNRFVLDAPEDRRAKAADASSMPIRLISRARRKAH